MANAKRNTIKTLAENLGVTVDDFRRVAESLDRRTPVRQVWRSDLSTITSRIASIRRVESGEYDDAGSFGYDCSAEIGRKAEREICDVLFDHGWTADEYNNALRERTTDRFAHFSGLEV